MKRLIVAPGERYGRLSVVAEAERHRSSGGKSVRRFLCRCECGGTATVLLTHLSTGHVKSCGCLRVDVGRHNGEATSTHGYTGTPTFKCWDTMKQRCGNQNDQKYPEYGGRGISVCERWKVFQNFLDDMGEKPDGMTIDRIDVNGNYEPGNCRWATPIEQARNKRNNVLLTFRGETCCLAEWAERTGLTYRTICARHKSGWPVAKLLTTPSRRRASA
jgi:hypothetical protein